MINPLFHIYFTLFIIAPIILYIGITLFNDEKVGKFFAIMLLIFTIYIFLHHAYHIHHIYSKITKDETLSKEIGFFYILFAITLILFNSYLISHLTKD